MPHGKTESTLEIARYLDHLFPELRRLKPHDGPDQNAQQWELVARIVGVLQDVRADERRRQGRGQEILGPCVG